MDKPNANNIAAKYEACRLLAANIKDLVKSKKIDKNTKIDICRPRCNILVNKIKVIIAKNI